MRTTRIRASDARAGLRYDALVTTTKPLFIPLKTPYFRAFETGAKTTEYRCWGARWNATTCAVGRPTVLSLGYSGRRLAARVVRTWRVLARDLPNFEPYAPDDQLIAIELDQIVPL
jgi:hypothetical protein